MTNGSGNIQAEYAFDPFGRYTKIIETLAADFQYSGLYLQTRSSLMLARRRELSTALARWLNRDPLELASVNNLYDYVENDPINLVDISGLSPSGKSGGGGGGKGSPKRCRHHQPPWFPDCNQRDCCTDNFDKCTKFCDYWYRSTDNINCHECCGNKNVSCNGKTAHSNGDPYSASYANYDGANWQKCFDTPWNAPRRPPDG